MVVDNDIHNVLAKGTKGFYEQRMVKQNVILH